MTDYFAAQSAIEARLRACLPAQVPLMVAVDFAQAKDQAVGKPEVWLLFHSDQVKDTAEGCTLLEQRWMTLYLTPGAVAGAPTDGGVLSAITTGLAGFWPDAEGLGEVKRVGSMVPLSLENDGLVGYGLLFALDVTL